MPDTPINEWVDSTGATLYNVHRAESCKGRPCCIHNVSNHHMKTWPQLYRFDRRIMERVCTHGVGHPDPDDFRILNKLDNGIHGCCGCCHENNER